MRRLLSAALASVLIPLGATVAQTPTPTPTPTPAPYGLILRGGTVVDGTGAPRCRADVAVTRGHIARVGDLASAIAPSVSASYTHPSPLPSPVLDPAVMLET